MIRYFESIMLYSNSFRSFEMFIQCEGKRSMYFNVRNDFVKGPVVSYLLLE